MKTIYSILTMILITVGYLNAQNEDDALRYSQNFYGGTARSVSMGGAFGSLGGDFSSISYNPAGLGVYRSSELTFTPSLYYAQADANYLNSTFNDFKYNFNFNNMGLVGAYNSGNDDGWVSTNFAFGYNRMNNFHNQVMIQGVNNMNSITDYFANQADGYQSDDLFSGYNAFEAGLAWDSYLIDPNIATTDSNDYISVLDPEYGQTQRQVIETKGSIGEYILAMGANYKHKLYIGGSIGIQSVRYIKDMSHTEIDENDSINGFAEMTYKTHLNTRGTGFNFKFGMVYRPAEWTRIGLAVHTPTFFDMKDEYASEMDSYFDNGDSYHVKPLSDDGEVLKGIYDYRLTTPFRAMGSLSFIIMKKGLVSVDYEFIDYRTARLRASDYDFYRENGYIQSIYRATANIKAGLEYKINDIFAVRGGYAMYGSPYASTEVNKDNVTKSISAGFGLRDEGFFFDMAFVYTMASKYQYLYSIKDASALIDNNSSSVLATFGFRF